MRLHLKARTFLSLIFQIICRAAEAELQVPERQALERLQERAHILTPVVREAAHKALEEPELQQEQAQAQAAVTASTEKIRTLAQTLMSLQQTSMAMAEAENPALTFPRSTANTSRSVQLC